jgi:hypothetical protein
MKTNRLVIANAEWACSGASPEGPGYGVAALAWRPWPPPARMQFIGFGAPVASDPFLAQLKSQLDEQARKLLLRRVSTDFTKLRDDQIARRLGAADDQAAP